MADIDIINKLKALLSKDKKLSRLLLLEKQRRGLSSDSLVFVGMHNVAQHWWCTQYAILKSYANEKDFFYVYLFDRICYSYKLGLIKKLPRKYEAILDIGNEIQLTDIETLLNAKKDHMSTSFPVTSIEIYDNRSNRKMYINPNLDEKERIFFEAKAKEDGIILSNNTDDIDDSFLRGELSELMNSEKYPTIRWNFRWEKYSIIGHPDGITGEFIYEYKTTKNRFMLNYSKPVALTQADLYGYFYNRPQKRVQIYIEEERKVETYVQPINLERIEKTLNAFLKVDEGMPARPPKEFKCRKCEFRTSCPIKY